MSISFFNEDVDLPSLDFKHIKKLLKSEIRVNRLKLGIINFIFCSDDYLLDINIEFLQHDFYTDVISFDYSEDKQISGDIYISIERVFNNSIIFKQSFSNELVRVISHGFFHLLKYNDKEEEETKVMRLKETEIVARYHCIS